MGSLISGDSSDLYPRMSVYIYVCVFLYINNEIEADWSSHTDAYRVSGTGMCLFLHVCVYVFTCSLQV